MKAQQILRPWKGDKRWTEMSKRAAALKKAGKTPDEIAEEIAAEFGGPTVLAPLRERPQPYKIYGEIGTDIEYAALAQLQLALRLPIAVQGALMPDAHPGYVLPIGGVFAAHRAVSPAMVGVDIGCRMHLSVFNNTPEEFLKNRTALFDDLQAVTAFGAGRSRKPQADHAVLDQERWQLTPQTRDLRDKAAAQLGTSGSGNHFAELIVGELLPGASVSRPDGQPLNLPKRFCGLLTHSGSRAAGYAIANTYMKLAARETALQAQAPKMFEWLDLDRESGQEYWRAMELAGDYARANHEVIHDAFARRTRLRPFATVQNHHNFAWLKGDTVIHRKGATPAETGVLGVIPGSMGTASYLVAGCGNEEALCSAAHGAGRLGSRSASQNRISMAMANQFLKSADVIVAGLSVDEAPQAYKDIERVMQLQIEAGLVTPLARMRPIAVIMAGESGKE